jgi:S-adenosylmethionine/arginine decarboxylase-like enzyme
VGEIGIRPRICRFVESWGSAVHGLHLTAELYECSCDPRLLADVGALRELCLAICAEPGLTPVGLVFHQFGSELAPAGATGAVILAESHLAVHTWPEAKAVTLDLYVCNFSQDNSTRSTQSLPAIDRRLCSRAIGPTRTGTRCSGPCRGLTPLRWK